MLDRREALEFLSPPMSSKSTKPTILFAPETLNLAEVTRTLEIAKVAQRSFNCIFASYDSGRRNHAFIENAGFRIVELAPQLDDAAIEVFWKKNRGDALAEPYFSEDELTHRVSSELALYQELDVKAVVTGFCLSTAISARVAKIPLVWINQTTWLREYFQKHATWPDAIDHAAWRILLPENLRNRLAGLASPITFWTMNRGFNGVAKKFGLRPYSGSELLEGDYNLFAEPPDFSGLEIPSRLEGRYRFIGPLFAGLPVETPAAVRDIPRDRPIVYFAMGSSGVEELIRELIPAFAGQPYRVIAPVAPLLRRGGISVPDNVVVTGWIPAEEVNPMADVSVVHGGIGTLLTACAAGTPIVGIPNGNPEQECNLQCLVRKGFAVHLHKRRVRPADVLAAIEDMLGDRMAKAKARSYSKSVLELNGPENGAQFLEQNFRDSTK